MIIRVLFTRHILELLLILLSGYVVVKARGARRTSPSTAAFFRFAAVNFVYQVSDLCTNIFRDEAWLRGITVGCILYILLLSAMAFGSFLWLDYVEEELGPRIFISKRRKNLWAIPVFVFVALCLLSVRTGWVFTFDANGKYRMGSMFFLQYVFILFYVLIAMVRSAVNWIRAEEKHDTDRVLLALMGIDAAAAFLQLIFMTNLMPVALVCNVLVCYMNLYSEEVRRTLQREEKLHAERLKEANLRSEVLNEISNAIRWSYEIGADDRIISYSYAKKGEDIVLSDGFEGNPMAWADQVHPDDREAALRAFNAAIHDHRAETPYDSTYRIMGTGGSYVWLKVAGRMYRREDGSGEMLGVSMDITDQMEEQQKHLLGAVPISPDILSKEEIGMWAFELDEGQPPRMYGDEAMLRLVGLTRQVPPEQMYHAWYDQIDEGSYGLVADAVAKMSSGEHAEVQYPWHHPNGHTLIVRCGGVRNPEYTKGIRVEGTHQNVTEVLHFDEEERRRARQTENDLIIAKLRADSLAFISDNEPDLDRAINFFGGRILEISGCDQVVWRELGGRKTVLNAPGIEEVPEEICSRCPFSRFDCPAFEENGTVLMDDCRLGCRGLMAPADCPAKSSFMQMIYSGWDLVGKLTIHYLNAHHTFTENSINIMKTVAVYLGLLIGRVNERKAEIARIEAESSNRAKTEFLFNMSHDIRTPMNAIIGFTDKAIKHKDDPEIFEESLGKVKSSSEYLLRIVNDILDMAKIESGKLELNPELHFGDKGSNALIEVFGAEAARKGIEFRAEYDIQDRYFWIDENRTNQIVANLVSNAIKYTEPGGEILYSVRQVPCERAGFGRYVLTVSDTGCGMTQEFLTRIFDAFERDPSAIRSGQQGTGLGMAIVKKLVDAMGGTIEVTSEPGKGTSVCFTSEHRLATREEIDHYRVPDREAAEESFGFAGKRVLLVEDNELNREIAGDLLEEEGLTVENAGDGTEAVRILKEKGPAYYDFILMDIQMPVMNGYDATKAIRAMYPDSRVPIIALSANAFEEDKAASIAAGMDGHVAKPIDAKELFKALERFL